VSLINNGGLFVSFYNNQFVIVGAGLGMNYQLFLNNKSLGIVLFFFVVVTVVVIKAMRPKQNDHSHLCKHCNKRLGSHNVEYEGKNYHKRCFDLHVRERCSICKGPFTGTISVDHAGNKFHSKHIDEFSQCNNCGILICDALTGGGQRYPDGREMCSKCQRPVLLPSEKKQILQKVYQRLVRLGLPLSIANISVEAVDLKTLLSYPGSILSVNTRGFCESTSKVETRGSEVVSKRTNHKIFLVNQIPEISIESILAHELMHAWINENCQLPLSSDLLEGSCNYISFLYLENIGTDETKGLIRALENDPDKDYGIGFLKVREKVHGKDLVFLLNYLKNNTRI